MTELEEIIAGLKILADHGATVFCAEHDQIYIHGIRIPFTEEEEKTLDDLGFFEGSSENSMERFV